MAYGAEDFATQTNVSRETLAAYSQWHAQLSKWNARINLVAPASLDTFWHRHALDSWQVTQYLPQSAHTVIDLGSGAGFPGLAVAIWGRDRHAAGFEVSLVESVGKKANFLTTMIRELHLPARVDNTRCEVLASQPRDVITARAFAPLDKLLGYAHNFWSEQTEGLFHKGENVKEELTIASQAWQFEHDIYPSLSHEGGVILHIKGLGRK